MNSINRAVLDRAPDPFGHACDQQAARPAPDRLNRQASADEGAPAACQQATPWTARLPARLAAWVAGRLRARRDRLALLELNDAQLKDIGLSRCQAYGEAERYRRGNSYRLERHGR